MYRSTIALCAILGASTAALGQVGSSPRLTAARVDSFVSARVAADAFSGAVLVANASGVIYQRATGMANREQSTLMNLDSKLQIASTTKLFTSIAIRQLEQAGKLSLTDTVGKFLPDYPNAVVRSRVTVDQLLRHRSGVGSFWNAQFVARRANLRTTHDYMELFQNDSLLFEPGTSETYSNGGYVLLGAIIERVSGQPYHDYVQEHIFRPAEMSQSMPYDRRAPRANAAVGYTAMGDGPVPGDTRLAGPAQRPGTAAQSVSPQPRAAERRAPSDTTAAPGGMRLRIRGPDGKELTPEQAREAMAQRAGSGVRRPNTELEAGVSGPAGDHYSTVGDFLKLARALTSFKLLDSSHTAALLGSRYAAGDGFRQAGGGPGVNAEFSVYPSGEVIVVLGNFDPPCATDVAVYIRSLIGTM